MQNWRPGVRLDASLCVTTTHAQRQPLTQCRPLPQAYDLVTLVGICCTLFGDRPPLLAQPVGLSLPRSSFLSVLAFLSYLYFRLSTPSLFCTSILFQASPRSLRFQAFLLSSSPHPFLPPAPPNLSNPRHRHRHPDRATPPTMPAAPTAAALARTAAAAAPVPMRMAAAVAARLATPRRPTRARP